MCEAVEEAPPTRSLTRDQYNVAVQKEGRIDRPDWQLSEVPASKVRCRGARGPSCEIPGRKLATATPKGHIFCRSRTPPKETEPVEAPPEHSGSSTSLLQGDANPVPGTS